VLCCGSTALACQWRAYTGTFQRVGDHLQLPGLLHCCACGGWTVCQQQPCVFVGVCCLGVGRGCAHFTHIVSYVGRWYRTACGLGSEDLSSAEGVG
jgi:hypothetical protein